MDPIVEMIVWTAASGDGACVGIQCLVQGHLDM